MLFVKYFTFSSLGCFFYRFRIKTIFKKVHPEPNMPTPPILVCKSLKLASFKAVSCQIGYMVQLADVIYWIPFFSLLKVEEPKVDWCLGKKIL